MMFNVNEDTLILGTHVKADMDIHAWTLNDSCIQTHTHAQT